jgi:putative colanic acid biosynthesis glycosyltransferase WcaI
MKILYISQYFPPEMGAPAARAVELARHWSEAGHGVSVLTGFPNHPTGVVPAEWRSRFHRLACHEKHGSVDVFRTWLWPLPNRKAHERIRNYFSFCVSAAIRGLGIPRPDVVIATSPQLLVGLSGWWLARIKQVPFVFEVRDLWPESLAAVGVGTNGSLLHRSLSGIAGFLYSHADQIVVVTSAFREHLVKHWKVPREKIAVIENGVETNAFAPACAAENKDFRRGLGLDGKFVVTYIGTMGMAHGLETLLGAAMHLQELNPDVVFVVVGEGAEKERIVAQSRSQGLKNIRFIDQQARERIPMFISASDVCLVLLRKAEIFKTVIPTKMLEFMSCACPVILGVEGQAQAILAEAKAGLVIEPENSSALVHAISQFASNRDLGPRLGQQGREYVLRRCSRRETATNYVRVLEALLGVRAARSAEAAA